MQQLLTVAEPETHMALLFSHPYDPDADVSGWDLNQPSLSGTDKARALKIATNGGWTPIDDAEWTLGEDGTRWELPIEDTHIDGKVT